MTRTLTQALADTLAILNLCNVDQLRHELEQLQPGQPRAQAYDTDRTTSGQGPADPTHAAATNPSTAAADLKAYNDAVRRIARNTRLVLADSRLIAHLSDKHVPTHEPKRRQIIADTKGCHLHERAGIDSHHPARCTTDFASVLDTPLRDPIPVCHACQDFTRRNGQLPTNEEIIRHERTGKWKQRTDGKRASVFSARQIADEWDGAA